MKSPYVGLDNRAYWRTGVFDRHPLRPGDLYRKKFQLRPDERIVTAGSCFAQHIANGLRLHNYNVLDTEPPPVYLSSDTAKRFGFLLYSARYGNIYTMRQLLQLVLESYGKRSPVEVVWEKDGRFFDALRPSVEPEGLRSPEAVLTHRAEHLSRVRWLFDNVSLFIFTMGLTEAWQHSSDGTVYPTAPGTVAGSYNSETYRFHNFSYPEIVEDFLAVRQFLRERCPGIRFLLTVSPVPLTATAAGDHVACATMYSKSVLRAAAGYLAASYPDIDYFPSYEIVASPQSRGLFYENNLRSISSAGVDVVMRTFFEQHDQATPLPDAADPASEGPRGGSVDQQLSAEEAARQDNNKAFCDDEILEKFS